MFMDEKSLGSIDQAKEAALRVLLHNAWGPFEGLPRTAGWGPNWSSRGTKARRSGVSTSGFTRRPVSPAGGIGRPGRPLCTSTLLSVCSSRAPRSSARCAQAIRAQRSSLIPGGRLDRRVSGVCDPSLPGADLTLWTVAISAAVVGNGGAMSTAGAFIDMRAKSGGTTACNGQQHFDVLPADPVAAAFDESGSRGADEIGHLQGRPCHLFLLY